MFKVGTKDVSKDECVEHSFSSFLENGDKFQHSQKYGGGELMIRHRHGGIIGRYYI